MSVEHPVNQPINQITIYDCGSGDAESYIVGYGDVTRIEATTKSGMHADIPYVRVWKGNVAFAEFCQHNILAVYFVQDVDEHKSACGHTPEDWKCTAVDCPGIAIPF